MPPLIFQVASPLALILIPEERARELARHAQVESGATEAGGTLSGLRRGPHFEITDVTGPQPDDMRARYGFIRRARSHLRIILKLWRKSGHTVAYLGEWHTHPEAIPHPSNTDLAGWRSLAAEHRAPLIHVIVGIGQMGCWYCDEDGNVHLATRLAEQD